MHNLEQLRSEIDALDAELIEILAQRFRLTDAIGQLKKTWQLPPVDREREARQALNIRALAQQHGLRVDIAERVLRVVIDAVVINHQKI